ncbi:hypothetical protein Tco_1041041 [Tanacetum coccineum]|uniref:Uncharacterized protein n=1 Tax=Tanacetum coccineum TaxID=301880 RepID=A0ABQ5GFQ9_9ASTR
MAHHGRNNVYLESKEQLLLQPGPLLDLFNRLYTLTANGRPMKEVVDILSMLVVSNDKGVEERSELVIPLEGLNAAEEPLPLSLVLEGVVPVGDHEMEDVEDEVLLSDCLHRKMTRPSVHAGRSGSAVADDDEPEKAVAANVACGSKLGKKRNKIKAKKIVDDSSVAGGSGAGKPSGIGDQDAQAVFPSPQGCGSGVLDFASQGDKPIDPEDVEDPALVLASFDRALVDIAYEYAYLGAAGQSHRAGAELTKVKNLQGTIVKVTVKKEKSSHTLKANEAEAARRHGEEVTILKSQIAKREAEVRNVNDDLAVTIESNYQNYDQANFYKRSVMSLRAHLPSVKIRKEVLDVPKSVLKLDEGVVAIVSEEGAALYTRSWPYLLELVASKDEDMNDLLAIRAPSDVDASSSSQVP